MATTGADALGHPRALYRAGVVHSVLGCIDSQFRMLFAYVELLPLEMPAPPHDEVIRGPHLRHARYRLYANHVAVSVDEALSWFDNARRGIVVVHEDDGRLLAHDAPGVRICQPESRGQEPNRGWITGRADAPQLPFLSNWHGTPRMQHLIALNFAWSADPGEDAEANVFLDEQVGFRRTEWPQLLGSIHLVVPNPYARSLHERLTANALGEELIEVDLDRRHHVPAPDFRVDVIDEHPTGFCTTGSVPVGLAPTHVRILDTTRRVHASVWSNDGVLLELSATGSFLSDLPTVGIDVGGTQRLVHNEDGAGCTVDTQEVSVMHPMTGHLDAQPDTASEILATMFREREIRASATSLEQHWFANNESGARAFVLSLIAGARRQVMIADPYLGGIEVSRFGRAVRLAGVPVRILTSGMAFRQPDGAAPVVRAAQLHARLATWASTDPGLGQIDVRFMPSDLLHDRFLRVDDRLYTLGNSLNRIGHRGSLLLRVPDPTPMFDVLEEIWEDPTTRTLANYIASLPAT